MEDTNFQVLLEWSNLGFLNKKMYSQQYKNSFLVKIKKPK